MMQLYQKFSEIHFAVYWMIIIIIIIMFNFMAPCLLALLIVSPLAAACNSNDLRALQGFLQSLESGGVVDGWARMNSSDCCTWEGVTCASDNISSSRVVSLELGGKRLHGVLPHNSLAGLDQLRTLNLSQNFFKGFLPLEEVLLPHLEKLEVLDLSSNDLSGWSSSSSPIKQWGVNLPSLRYLDISENLFSGYVDAAGICNTARQLQVLDLSMNNYFGEIPVGFGNCSSLEHLRLSSNFFVGSLPDDLFRLPKLRLLDLQDNRFSGPLNPGVGNLSNLVTLDISVNEFSGYLPADAFPNLGKLEEFLANSNKFAGQLPSSLTNSPTISRLNLNNNSLSGEFEINCSAMVHLTSLNLGSNQFNGPIPKSLSSCQQLSIVNLARNDLGGQVPSSFSKLKALSYLSLSNNSLHNISGALLVLQHCSNLTALVLTLNFHAEVMPADSNLQYFKNLKILAIASCHLMGLIPTWLSACTQLQLLDISWNRLGGTIPVGFGNLKFLFYLDLSNNRLSGEIPKDLTELQGLISRNFSLKEPSQDFPFFLKKNLSARTLQYNQIWSFPPSLDLSYNRLTGPIWPEFGDLKALHVLDLSNNNLSGQIPSNLSGMNNLEALDFSYNNISGTIPPSLEILSFLSRFSVAYNHITGRIPYGGQFLTFPDSSFEGNKGLILCRALLSACSNESGPERPIKRPPPLESPNEAKDSIIGLPFGFGAIFGFVITVTIAFMSGWLLPKAKKRNVRISRNITSQHKRAFCSSKIQDQCHTILP